MSHNEEQLDLGKSIIDSAIGETSKIGGFLGTADSTSLEHGIALRSDGSTLRELYARLKAKYPGFGPKKQRVSQSARVMR